MTKVFINFSSLLTLDTLGALNRVNFFRPGLYNKNMQSRSGMGRCNAVIVGIVLFNISEVLHIDVKTSAHE
jgi:hypothetical protein